MGAVFAESHDLPHHVVDLPLAGGHRLGEAAQMLLDLPFSSFSRKELVPLLTHPSLMARFPDARPADWLRLIDDLGIVRGADRRDLAGSYLIARSKRRSLHLGSGPASAGPGRFHAGGTQRR